MKTLIENLEKISEMEQKITELEAIIKKQAAIIAEQQIRINYYEEQNKVTRRKLFGSSSERSPNQIYLEDCFNEAEDQVDESLPPDFVT